jgi:phosphopantothenoylcysteine synthetase/decarboxylase
LRNTAKKPIRVLVTGGPTRAYLDRVRFLTNVSSGELAYVLCKMLIKRGVEVALVSGPSSQPFEKLSLAEWTPIETTEEMHAAVMKLCKKFRPDFGVFTAAVLDFTPEKTRVGKVSSSVKRWEVKLKPTPKIIDDVGKKFPSVKKIGFKLEWKRGREKATKLFAMKNIRAKKLDALCLNFLSEIRDGRHPAQLITKEGDVEPVSSKREIASWIARYISDHA